MTDKDTKKVATKATPKTVKAKTTPYVVDSESTYTKSTQLRIANWRLFVMEDWLDKPQSCREVFAMTDKEIFEEYLSVLNPESVLYKKILGRS